MYYVSRTVTRIVSFVRLLLCNRFVCTDHIDFNLIYRFMFNLKLLVYIFLTRVNFGIEQG